MKAEIDINLIAKIIFVLAKTSRFIYEDNSKTGCPIDVDYDHVDDIIDELQDVLVKSQVQNDATGTI